MSNLKKSVMLVFVLVILQLSCSKIPAGFATKAGSLPVETLTQTSGIPSDWGKLISVVVSPEESQLSQLWFQDEKGLIHLAVYDSIQNKLWPEAVTIHRY